MKTPRITDFDPDAKVSNLKSSLDHMPAIEKQKTIKRPLSSTERVPQATSQGEKKRVQKATTPVSTVSQSQKRVYVRRTFDFYEDQISFLMQESLHERLAGKEGSMNAMVREAIDEWIKKRTTGK